MEPKKEMKSYSWVETIICLISQKVPKEAAPKYKAPPSESNEESNKT
jgi:hypothetical protein